MLGVRESAAGAQLRALVGAPVSTGGLVGCRAEGAGGVGFGGLGLGSEKGRILARLGCARETPHVFQNLNPEEHRVSGFVAFA